MSIKLEDIAKELGLSLMTVSRALNNKGNVKKETYTKIIKLAKEIGYVPNILARNLATNKTYNIGLVISDISNPFYAKITRVIQDIAYKKGYNITLFNTNEDTNLEKEALHSIIGQRCDGVLITSTEREQNYLADLNKYNLPVILINRRPKNNNISYVVCDNKKGGYLATTYLLGLGHRNIAHITGPPRITSVKDKIDGYIKAYKDYGLRANKDLIFMNEISMESAYKNTIKILKHDIKITAIFSYTDWMSIGVLKALKENNIKIPDDISLVGYDNLEFSSYLKAPLTTIDLPITQMGKKSIEFLLEKINNKELSNRIIRKVYEPKLIIRESCRKL